MFSDMSSEQQRTNLKKRWSAFYAVSTTGYRSNDVYVQDIQSERQTMYAAKRLPPVINARLCGQARLGTLPMSGLTRGFPGN